MANNDITVACFTDCNSGPTRDAIEAIFWATVAGPIPPAERDAFRDLWLSQYLRHEPHLTFIAHDAAGQIGGYLVGCHVDPSTSPRFASLAYFQTFKVACQRFPAHLHVNLSAAWRGRGIGGQLIASFAATVRAAGLPGFHVVTGADARNVSFYVRAGFQEAARTTNPRGRTVVFLGRPAG